MTTDGVEIGPPRPGDLGWLIGAHGRWYAAAHGLPLGFEATVAGIAADVAARLAPPRVSMFVARGAEGTPLGSLSVDADDPDEAGRGHVRIVFTEETARGRGIGARLLTAGLADLRRAGAPGAWLDTFVGLERARRLYVSAGFRLVDERQAATWGVTLREQRFVLDFA